MLSLRCPLLLTNHSAVSSKASESTLWRGLVNSPHSDEVLKAAKQRMVLAESNFLE